MLITCPNCKQTCNLEINDDFSEVSFTCPHCNSDVVVSNGYTVAKKDVNDAPAQTVIYRDREPEKKKSGGGCLSVVIVGLAVLFLLVLTCPDRNEHKETLKSVVTNALDGAFREQMPNKEEQWTAALVSGIASEVVIETLMDRLSVKNYLIFSVGEIYEDGEHVTVSIGILNHVFTHSEENVKHNIRRYMNQ